MVPTYTNINTNTGEGNRWCLQIQCLHISYFSLNVRNLIELINTLYQPCSGKREEEKTGTQE